MARWLLLVRASARPVRVPCTFCIALTYEAGALSCRHAAKPLAGYDRRNLGFSSSLSRLLSLASSNFSTLSSRVNFCSLSVGQHAKMVRAPAVKLKLALAPQAL